VLSPAYLYNIDGNRIAAIPRELLTDTADSNNDRVSSCGGGSGSNWSAGSDFLLVSFLGSLARKISADGTVSVIASDDKCDDLRLQMEYQTPWRRTPSPSSFAGLLGIEARMPAGTRVVSSRDLSPPRVRRHHRSSG